MKFVELKITVYHHQVTLKVNRKLKLSSPFSSKQVCFSYFCGTLKKKKNIFKNVGNQTIWLPLYGQKAETILKLPSFMFHRSHAGLEWNEGE